ncbi:MAG: C4-dicarboxylate transporter DctA [Proteobacteria bacterium]|nr:C4-dicarboxylate transporter DctA [Pseudomonadota bacterium]
MSRFVKSLFGQVLIALAVGVLVGMFWPEFAVKLKPLGDGFIKLIKMLIPILVFCVVVHGIAGTGDLRRVGRVGVKALIYFEVVTTIALALGLVLALVFQPGAGMNIDPSKLDPSALSAYTDNAQKLSSGGVVDFLMRLIPSTVGGAFATGDVLQVLMFAILFGCALALLGDRGAPISNFIESLSHVIFKIMGIIIRVAPLGVLGAIAYTVGAYGVGSLKQLGALVALFYVSVLIFVVVVLGLILRVAGFNIFKLMRYLREELMVVLATTSSDAVLPQVMSKLKRMGIKDSTVGLVIPTGYSFNLDAFSIYITLAAVFIAQATNTDITMGHLLTILLVALVTSKGAHGVPGSAIVVLAATLQVIPDIPAIGLVMVLSVDWFMGIARALGNFTGNAVATVVIGSWEGDIDRERAHAVLNGQHVTETPDDEDAELTGEPAKA